jgi:hypothetical protein
MAEYQLIISGVHYGANGDFVAGQKDTEEMHMRTREMLSWIDRERPIVVLSADPQKHIHKEAIMARAQGRRIGRVAYEDVDVRGLSLAIHERSSRLGLFRRRTKAADTLFAGCRQHFGFSDAKLQSSSQSLLAPLLPLLMVGSDMKSELGPAELVDELSNVCL